MDMLDPGRVTGRKRPWPTCILLPASPARSRPPRDEVEGRQPPTHRDSALEIGDDIGDDIGDNSRDDSGQRIAGKG